MMARPGVLLVSLVAAVLVASVLGRPLSGLQVEMDSPADQPDSVPAVLPADQPDASPAELPAPETPVEHYEYVVLPGNAYVFNMDRGFEVAKVLALPPTTGSNIKGVVAHPPTGVLYVSYGGDGGADGTGSLLKYDLLHDRIIWTRDYRHGIDSMAISPDGGILYMPLGEEAKSSREWMLLDTSTGNAVGSVNGGLGPHNTVVAPSGRHVYLAGREDRTLYVRNVTDGSLFTTVGPFIDTIRPFTMNGAETLVFTTHTGLLGFQVASISSGGVLYTVRVEGFNSASNFTTPSHGISLSPDEREIYLIDTANAYAHVYDVSQLPDQAPVRAASIKLSRDFSGREDGCGTGWCGRIAWLQHSRDGRFVFVGDSGDVLDTHTRQVVATLAPLRHTRKMLEIDWAGGLPVFATPREGLGYQSP
jgi:sugar lactone lactonase YvrE